MFNLLIASCFWLACIKLKMDKQLKMDKHNGKNIITY